MKPEFTIKQIRAFIDMGCNSIEARAVKSAMQHYDELLQQRDEMTKGREQMFQNMQYYMEYCQTKGYVTPQEWIEKHKHF